MADTDGLQILAEQGKANDLLTDYVSKADLAQQFGVSVRTVERWVRLRLLPPPVRLGRISLFHVPTLREFLESDAKRSLASLMPDRHRRGKW
jgi:hypothetical protein